MADANEIKQLFANFSKDILAKINIIHTQLTDVNERLTTIESGCEANHVTAELEREKELLAIKLEMTTKEPMEKAGHDFLKAQTKNTGTQAMAEITAKLEAKLFYKDDAKPEIAPDGAAPPTPGTFPALEIRPHKLSFATYDGKEDPLPWLNRREQFFKGQRTPDSKKNMVRILPSNRHRATVVHETFTGQRRDGLGALCKVRQRAILPPDQAQSLG
jgi:hypothetical protein